MYLPEERETVISYDEFDNSWTFETSVRRHITKIEKRIELYEILAEELDERGNRVYIRVKMTNGTINPFAKPKRQMTESQKQNLKKGHKSILG